VRIQAIFEKKLYVMHDVVGKYMQGICSG
jgi:hypothetical protein